MASTPASGPWDVPAPPSPPPPFAPPPAPRRRFAFLRGAWKVLVAIKDLLVLILMLLFFAAIWGALSARGHGAIGTGALVVKLDGTIVEQPEAANLSAALSGSAPVRQYALRDVVRAIRAAATDDRVKTVVLDLDGFLGAGAVAIDDVGAAIDTVRAAKKPVFAYATGYTDDSYALAAHASQIWLEPMGLALFAGPGGSTLYYKGLLDRLGVKAHIYRVGTYKSAVEPYMLDKQSPEARAANEALAKSLFDNWLAGIAKARPQAKVSAVAGDPVAAVAGKDLSQAAVDAGLVDRLGGRAAFAKAVAEVAGPGTRGAPFATIEWKSWVAAHPAPTSGQIGVVTVAGVITDGEAGPGAAGGETIATLIDEAVASGKYKALVVRVDSPGGSALASERIRDALAGAKAKGLPIVVSMSNVAASGGYWVAMAGDRVFAEPATITGSIGVFGVIPTFEAALAKWGVTSDGVRTTPLSGQPDILGGTSPAFDAVVQRGIEATYARFIALVSGARKLPAARVDEIGQGRVWDGGSARQIGLIDAFGGIDEAIAEAARRAKLDPQSATAVWIEKPAGFFEGVAGMFAEDDGGVRGGALATLARLRRAAFDAAVADAVHLAEGQTLQARCLECPAPPVSPRRDARLLDTLMFWKNR